MPNRRNKCKPRVVPQQDKRICGSICFCQLIVVLSCVSLIYLTVAIYIPSYRAFKSGYETVPVMCQTINTSVINNCSWASCGEWCLTKTSGFCPQMHVTTRQNGTNLQLQNCTGFTSVTCPPAEPGALNLTNCNNGNTCNQLDGVFNCSLGRCANMSEIFLCHYRADGFTIDTDKDNMKLNGFFECKGSRCTKIKKSFHCDRLCDTIFSAGNNVFITMDDTLYMANCTSAIAFTTTNGQLPGKEIEPTEIWTQSPEEVLMLSCHTVKSSNNNINATDCINGTLYETKDIPTPTMNFTTFWSLENKWRQFLDPDQIFVPMQNRLTIYNSSHLSINLDGCVNTLKGECTEFLQTHGRDGRNQTAQSRFPCFYHKNNSALVLARFDLNKTYNELIVSASVPSVLFIVSFITLCIIMYSVKVGDDTKMRCKYCMGSSVELSEMSEISTANRNRYEVSSPSDEFHRKDLSPLFDE